MKNAIIGVLLIVIGLLATAERDRSGTQAMIEDTTLPHHAKWRPADQMLFLPCPLTPRNIPRWQQRSA